MDLSQSQRVLDRLLQNEIGPIEAADELDASGEFMVGMAGGDSKDVSEEQVTRFHAMLGRLSWHAMRRSGVTGIDEPKTIDECLAFFETAMERFEEEDADGSSKDGTA